MKIEAEVWEVKEGEVVALKTKYGIFYKKSKSSNNKKAVIPWYQPLKPVKNVLTRKELFGTILRDPLSDKVREKYGFYIRKRFLNDIKSYLTVTWRTRRQLQSFIEAKTNLSYSSVNRVLAGYLFYLDASNKLETTGKGYKIKYRLKL